MLTGQSCAWFSAPVHLEEPPIAEEVTVLSDVLIIHAIDPANRPIPNAAVIVYTPKGDIRFQGHTDNHGKRTVSGLPTGTYHIIVSRADYYAQGKIVKFVQTDQHPAETALTFALLP